MFAVPKKTGNKKFSFLPIILGIEGVILLFVFFRKGAIATKSISSLFASPTPTVTINPTVTSTPSQTPTPTNIPTPTVTSLPSPTPTATPMPTLLPASLYDFYFDQYSSLYGISKELLKKIAYCESGINPGAQNGEYGGMFQFTVETWKATRNQMGQDENPDLRFDAKEAIETTAFKINHGGQDAWKNCL